MPPVVIAFSVNMFVQYVHLSSLSARFSPGELSDLLKGGRLASLKKNWFEGVRLSNFYIPKFGVGFFQVSWADKHEACRQWDGSCVRLTFIALSSATYSYCLRDCCWLVPFGGSIASMERPKTTKDYFLLTYLIIRSWSKLISLSFEMKD